MAKKVNHTNTKCCICGSPESYIKYIDSNTKKPVYLWYKKYEEDGSWLNNAYTCNKCWNKTSPNSFDNIQKSLRDKRTRKYRYNKSHTCDRCGETLGILGDRVSKEYDEKGYWTKKWLCAKCGRYDDYKERFIKDHNIGNLDPYSSTGKGYIFQTVTCKTRNIKDLNVENDNWKTPIDHSRDPELGIIQTKGAVYNSLYKTWHNGSITNEYDKVFDYLIYICIDEFMKKIVRVYIFPKKEIMRGITIYNNDGYHWYDKYRVDEKPYNDAYHCLDENDLKSLRDVKLFIKSVNE